MTFIIKQIIAGAALAEVTAGLRLGNTKSLVSTATADVVSLVEKAPKNEWFERAKEIEAMFEQNDNQITDAIKEKLFEIMFQWIVKEQGHVDLQVAGKLEVWDALVKKAKCEHFDEEIAKEASEVFEAVCRSWDEAKSLAQEHDHTDQEKIEKLNEVSFPTLSSEQNKQIMECADEKANLM